MYAKEWTNSNCPEKHLSINVTTRILPKKKFRDVHKVLWVKNRNVYYNVIIVIKYRIKPKYTSIANLHVYIQKMDYYAISKIIF